MSIYVGGLRARMIHEAIYREIRDSLAALGWFDNDRAHSPIIFLPSSVEDFENVTPNTAVLTSVSVDESEEEMGSLLSEHRWTYYVDFFAEDEAIGTHFITDVKDILSGRMPTINRSEPKVAVFDYTKATPDAIFSVVIENIYTDRPSSFGLSWQRYFRVLHFEAVDYYGQDTDNP